MSCELVLSASCDLLVSTEKCDLLHSKCDSSVRQKKLQISIFCSCSTVILWRAVIKSSELKGEFLISQRGANKEFALI